MNQEQEKTNERVNLKPGTPEYEAVKRRLAERGLAIGPEVQESAVPEKTLEAPNPRFEKIQQDFGRYEKIRDVKSFEELFAVLDVIGEVKGSTETYSADKLKKRIELMIRYINDREQSEDKLQEALSTLMSIPREYELRKKVRELSGIDRLIEEEKLKKIEAIKKALDQAA